MKTKLVSVFVILLAFALLSPQAMSTSPLSGPGGVDHPVSSRDPQIRKLFNEGLFYIYAFNHDEAVRRFEKAARLDPGFAMAYWGKALALGPNINLPADPARQKAAYEAIRKALELSAKAPEQEAAYIKALATRYTGKPDEDLHKLAYNYADAMRQLHRKYQDDDDAATLYAESLMDLRPWQLWSAEGRPANGTLEIVSVLESVLRRHPSHVGANHYYIHAVEASSHPEWALPSADRLRAMQLPAGHLVHMPAHIYMRTGDYAAAAEVNRAAAATDEAYLKASGAEGIYPMMYYNHNLHFLAVASGIEGRYQDAIVAAEKLARHAAPHVKEMPTVEFFLPTPTLIQVMFHKWQEILRLPQPGPQMPISTLTWHFAQGVAWAASGDLAKARKERDALAALMQKMPPEASVDLNSATDIAKVALSYLDGKIAMAEGDLTAAANALKKGVMAEDALRYTEPPSWILPLREPLGAVLLKKRDYREAETVFREELAKNPRSGRALFGLWKSLEGEGRRYEAELVQGEFAAAWSNADTKLDLENL